MSMLRKSYEFADLMTLEEFDVMAGCGAISSWDGSGYPVKYVDGVPYEDESYSCWDFPREEFTHVAWYNK